MNFNKLCNDFLKSNSKIRFVGILNSRGGLIAQKIRNDYTPLLSDDEFQMIVYYTTDRLNRLQNLQHKLGTVKETVTKYEYANTITMFLDKNLILISTEPNSDVPKIISTLGKIIYKRPTKKTASKKRPTKKTASKKRPTSRISKKDNVSRLKPKLDKLEKRVNSLYQKHKK
jgi:hypothetical protein